MTVTYEKTKDKYKLKLDGHCNTAPKGYDLVCAAASILCLTMAQVLQENGEKLRGEPKIELNDGDALLVWKPYKKYESALYNSLYTVLKGYQVLAYNYPECIELIKK